MHRLLIQLAIFLLAFHSLEDGVLGVDQLYLALVHLFEDVCDLLGLFLGRSLRALLGAFPMPIVGGMMAVVGVQLGKFGLDLRGRDLAVIIITGAVSVATSMALGFLTGILLFHAWTWLRPRKST